MGILAGLFSVGTRASVENPSLSLNDPATYDLLAGDAMSDSGVAINSRTILRWSAVWRAVSLLSRDVGKLPLVLYRRTGDDGRERANEHPASALVRAPNDEQTALVYWQRIMFAALLEGNGLAWIRRDGAAQPVELIPLPMETSYPVRANGVLWYVTAVNGAMRKLPARDVFDLRGLSHDGISGLRLVDVARDSVGLGMARQKYASKFFSNGAEARLLLEHPAKLSLEAQNALVASWNRMHQGLDNTHKTAVLQEGMKAHQVSINARDAQLVESAKFSLTDVANWFGIPPHKVGGEGRTAYASLEQENQSYLDEALDGWLVAIEQEAAVKLLTEQERRAGSHYFEFNRSALVRANMGERFSAYNLALTGGWINRNEVRRRENMPPIDGGDTFLEPLNLVPVGSRAAVAAVHRRLLRSTITRMAGRLAKAAVHAAGNADTFLDWLDAGLSDGHGEAVRGALADVCPAVRAVLGDSTPAASDLADDLLADARRELLEVSGRAQPASLAKVVSAWATRWATDVAERMSEGIAQGV